MRRRRLVLSSNLMASEDQEVELSEALSKHVRVLRLQEADEIELVDGEGGRGQGSLHWRGNAAVVRINKLSMAPPDPWPFLKLLAGVGKGEKLDVVVRQASELGAGEVVPFLSERCVATRERRIDRLQIIADDGLRISGRSYRTKVHPLHQWSQALSVEADLKLVLAWGASSSPLQTRLAKPAPETIALMIGPEGGFSESELQEAEEAQFLRSHLGPYVLRTETAGPAVVAMVRYHYGL